ncbi:MAG: DUF1206 domain-containing protein [Actinobacteria bacterium]|nr:DUF1206 domain-containing protein [Actinomycetota bacterium]
MDEAGTGVPMSGQLQVNRGVERAGRAAIATQGVLYAVVGLLAAKVAGGDRDADPSQRGALRTVAQQPYGKVLLVVLAVGLAAYAGWRAVLAVRGDLGGDEDGASLAKRAANAGRAVLYASLTVAAIRLLTEGPAAAGGGDRGGGDGAQRSTSTLLSMTGGPVIVVVVGLAVIGTGAWNGWRAVDRSFLDSLDCSRLDDRQQRAVGVLGSVGYAARGVAFALVGWFLVTAGLQHDASEARGLDGALVELVRQAYGPPILVVLALGLLLFGAFRIVDAALRRPTEITHA